MRVYEVGESVRGLRKEAGLTTVTLAELAGVDRSWLSRLETGRLTEAGIGKIEKVLRVFDKQLAVTSVSPMPTLDDLLEEQGRK